MRMLRFLGVITLFVLLVLPSFRAAAQNDFKQPRILLLLDESSSMGLPWIQGKERSKAAKEIILGLMDSIYAINDKVEFALRAYGQSHASQENNCTDTKLEVMFSKNNRTQMSLRLEDLHPRGITPIAYSLQQAAENDLVEDWKNYYSIILITDGGESCNGNICDVVRTMLNRKIYFKPYIICLADSEPLQKEYECLGTYLATGKQSDIPANISTIASAYRHALVHPPAATKPGKPAEIVRATLLPMNIMPLTKVSAFVARPVAIPKANINVRPIEPEAVVVTAPKFRPVSTTPPAQKTAMSVQAQKVDIHVKLIESDPVGANALGMRTFPVKAPELKTAMAFDVPKYNKTIRPLEADVTSAGFMSIKLPAAQPPAQKVARAFDVPKYDKTIRPLEAELSTASVATLNIPPVQPPAQKIARAFDVPKYDKTVRPMEAEVTTASTVALNIPAVLPPAQKVARSFDIPKYDKTVRPLEADVTTASVVALNIAPPQAPALKIAKAFDAPKYSKTVRPLEADVTTASAAALKIPAPQPPAEKIARSFDAPKYSKTVRPLGTESEVIATTGMRFFKTADITKIPKAFKVPRVGKRKNEPKLNGPTGLCVDQYGNIFIADNGNNRIRKVDTRGIMTTVAGSDTSGYNRDGVDATKSALNSPHDVTVDAAGNLYFTDRHNRRIRKVNSDGIISTIAGTGKQGFNMESGKATAVELFSPRYITMDKGGNLYISDSGRVWKLDHVSGNISTYAGNGRAYDRAKDDDLEFIKHVGDDGPANRSYLLVPAGLSVDPDGNVIVVDAGHYRVREINAKGIITTIGGNGKSGFSGDRGPATMARFALPVGAACDAQGNTYIADQGNNVIRKISPRGTITVFAGTSVPGYAGDGGAAIWAKFSFPSGVACDKQGNVYVADQGNNVIRRIDIQSGNITTVAGNGEAGFSGDGESAIAKED